MDRGNKQEIESSTTNNKYPEKTLINTTYQATEKNMKKNKNPKIMKETTLKKLKRKPMIRGKNKMTQKISV